MQTNNAGKPASLLPVPAGRSEGRDWQPGLHGLRNLGPKSVARLATLGITTREQLAQAGALECCRLLMERGIPVSLNMAYAIEGALMDADWRALPIAFRRHLKAEFFRLRHRFAGKQTVPPSTRSH